MKIKDLPVNANFNDIRVIIPENVYQMSSLPRYNIDNVPVYLVGWTMGDFFVKPDKESEQIFPMFWDFMPSDIQEWEVIEDTDEEV